MTKLEKAAAKKHAKELATRLAARAAKTKKYQNEFREVSTGFRMPGTDFESLQVLAGGW